MRQQRAGAPPHNRQKAVSVVRRDRSPLASGTKGRSRLRLLGSHNLPAIVSERAVTGPRAADDFTTIRARMEELRREGDRAGQTETGRPAELQIGRGDRLRPVAIVIRRLRDAAG